MIVGIIGLVISLFVVFMAHDDRPRRPDDYPTRRL
jgi:Co/Zn/Cd efflux system component